MPRLCMCIVYRAKGVFGSIEKGRVVHYFLPALKKEPIIGNTAMFVSCANIYFAAADVFSTHLFWQDANYSAFQYTQRKKILALLPFLPMLINQKAICPSLVKCCFATTFATDNV